MPIRPDRARDGAPGPIIVDHLAPADAPLIGEPDEGLVLRLSISGGWETPNPFDTEHLSVEDDGRAVRVRDSSVFSSTDDYTSLRLDDDGVAALRRRIAESGLYEAPAGAFGDDSAVSPTDRTAALEVAGFGRITVGRLGSVDGYTEKQFAWRSRFDELLADLVDLDWAAAHIVAAEAPWVPDSMTVLAGDISQRSGLPADAPFAPWPLDVAIAERAEGTTTNPYDEEELVLCLQGDEVGPVFALLTGVNHAYLRVDDGERWELNVWPHQPGYRLASDPCP